MGTIPIVEAEASCCRNPTYTDLEGFEGTDEGFSIGMPGMARRPFSFFRHRFKTMTTI